MPLSKQGIELSIEDLPGEEWRGIEGFDKYYVSNMGRVKSFRRAIPKILSAGLNHASGGYLYVHIRGTDGFINRLVHLLVAKAFLGDCPENYEVNHIDLNKTNNSALNLEYVTHTENIRHASRNGAMGNTGIINVSGMIDEYKSGEFTVTEIARRHNISISSCWVILNGKSPLYNTKSVVKKHVGYKITPSMVNEIKALMNEGNLTQAQIAKMYSVDAAVITRIKNGTYYNRPTKEGTK